MKISHKLLSLALAAAPLLLPHASQAAECTGTVGHVQSVSLDASRFASTNYSGSGGQFDPTPLLSTSVTVPGGLTVVNRKLVPATSCLIAHFSAEATALDNGIVFQVLLDGVPMQGNSPSGPNSIASPAIFQGLPVIDNSSGVEVGRPTPAAQMLSYTLFAPVVGGTHTVKVLVANCCSANTAPVQGGFVQAATLTLESK